MPFWIELEEVEDRWLVVPELVALDVDEAEETLVPAEDVDEEVALLSVVVVTVELIADEDEALEEPGEVVREELETDEGTEPDPEPDGRPESDDVEVGPCRLMAAPSARMVSATATTAVA